MVISALALAISAWASWKTIELANAQASDERAAQKHQQQVDAKTQELAQAQARKAAAEQVVVVPDASSFGAPAGQERVTIVTVGSNAPNQVGYLLPSVVETFTVANYSREPVTGVRLDVRVDTDPKSVGVSAVFSHPLQPCTEVEGRLTTVYTITRKDTVGVDLLLHFADADGNRWSRHQAAPPTPERAVPPPLGYSDYAVKLTEPRRVPGC